LLPEDATGVEIGLGTGRFAAPLGIKLGVEPSKAMGQIAQQRGVAAICGIAEALPLANAQFGFVLMVTTICFLDDIEAAFREAYRVLKLGGSIVIGFIDRNGPLGRRYKQEKAEGIFYKEAVFYSVDEVVLYLRKAGFWDFAFRQTIFQPLRRIREREPLREGYGRGSFVVVRGLK
jgi:SAM-dependent methyltransferase